MPDNIKRSTHTCILVIDAPAAHSGKNGQSLCFRTLELGCVQSGASILLCAQPCNRRRHSAALRLFPHMEGYTRRL
eukprot:scaffold252132_cov19-Tisochrysis_lutea.AAC.1